MIDNRDISKAPPTILSESAARELATTLNADDRDGWHYKAVKRPSGHVVEVRDEAGTYMGAL